MNQPVELDLELPRLLERAGVGIARIDTTGRYLLVNSRYCELLGRPRDELLAARIQDYVHAEDLPATLEAFIGVFDHARLADQKPGVRGRLHLPGRSECKLVTAPTRDTAR